jgi:hypothetical protein
MILALVLSASLTAGPLYYDRPVTKADLDGRPLRELALMRNWIWARAGHKFRKDWLDQFFRSQDWYKPAEKDGPVSDVDKKNSKFIAEYESKLPKAFFEKKRAALAKATTPEDKIELRLVSERLGVADGIAEQDRNPLEDPSMLDKLLEVKSLEDLSRRDLRILRNTVYARHGRPFQSPLLRAHFGTMEWYREDKKYTDARLTEIDKKNVQIILSLEDSLGGPLTDADQNQGEAGDGWYGVA